MRYRDYVLGKRIAVIGIGPHGEMLADIKFFVKSNALVSVYDLRSEGRLLEHATTLRSFGLANLVLGHIPAEDLIDMDLIILSHEYPRTSSFLTEARNQGVEIEYPETLFLKLAPPVTVVGIMGACGKSAVMSMLTPMLDATCAANGQECVSVDPESVSGILTNLRKLKSGDVVVMKIVASIMQEINALRWSPQIAIFTTTPSRSSYKISPFELIGNQTYNNYVIAHDQIIDEVRASGFQTKAKLLRTKASVVPIEWLPNADAPCDRDNAALALEAARVLKTTDETAQAVLVKWKPLKGRIERLKKIRGVDIVNDSASLNPESTIAALASVSKNRNVVLIFGGADHGADYREFYSAVKKYAHTAVVIPGSGTLRERQYIHRLDDVHVISAPSVEEAVRQAMDHAKRGDVILYSPAFDVGGIDVSRRERSERFLRAVRTL
ncbi:MAG TPA: cyanophycin synthetase [Candidatus Paceibacterota bacterium]